MKKLLKTKEKTTITKDELEAKIFEALAKEHEEEMYGYYAMQSDKYDNEIDASM